MNWQTVELQIETLIPGVLILSGILLLGHIAVPDKWPTGQDVLNIGLFVSASYALGLVSSYLTRIVLDFLSERGPRAMVVHLFSHTTLSDAVKVYSNGKRKARFHADLEHEQRRFVGKWIPCVAKWNAVYRCALRDTSKRSEVDRRRSQGRLMRNLASPLLLGAVLISEGTCQCLLYAISGLVICVLLYAYAECVNFVEAYDIEETNQPAPSANSEIR